MSAASLFSAATGAAVVEPTPAATGAGGRSALSVKAQNRLNRARATAAQAVSNVQAQVAQSQVGQALTGAATGTPPQSFADILTKAGLSTTQATTLKAQANANGAQTTGPSAAVQSKTVQAAANPAAVLQAATVSPAAASATATQAGATQVTTTQASTTQADAAQANADAALSPLYGLSALLFSGPLQTPSSAADVTVKASQIQAAVQRQAKIASPTTLADWSSTLSSYAQTLNAAEKASTGVDPTAPPKGWIEPSNFQAARSLLTSLQTTVAQAQAGQGTVPALAQPAKPATVTQADLQGIKTKFLAPSPTGQATVKLFGADPVATPVTGAAARPAAQTAQSTRTQEPSAQTLQTQTSQAQSPQTQASQATTVRTAQAQAAQTQNAPARAEVRAQSQSASGAEADASQPTTSQALQAPSLALTPLAARPAAQTPSSAPETGGTIHAQALTAAASPGGQADTGVGLQTEASDSPLAAIASAAASATTGAQTSTTDANAATTAAAADPSRLTPAAIGYLASAMVKQAGGKATSFNIELHPADLGRVDIKLQIQADGQLAARMAFDNPAAAASFQAHADELRRSLEQAGFQLSNDALSFTGGDAQTAGGGSGAFAGQDRAGQDSFGQTSTGAKAFAGAQAAGAADAAANPMTSAQAIGLDVRI